MLITFKFNLPLAFIEAKANKHSICKGMQQALYYSGLLEVPFVFLSNGDSFIFHDKTSTLETEVSLADFPTITKLWDKYCQWKDYMQAHLPIITQDYHNDGNRKLPHYYQLQAINKTIEALSRGQNRILLVIAIGTTNTSVSV